MINIAWWSILIFCSSVFIYGSAIFVILILKYLRKGADERTPYIISFIFYGVLAAFLSIRFIITGHIPSIYLFILKTYPLFVVFFLNLSRLYGVNTMNIARKLKYNVYIAYSVFFIFIIFAFILDYPQMNTTHKVTPMSEVQFRFFAGLFYLRVFPHIWYWSLIASIINLTILLWFDTVEKRFNFLKLDLLLVIIPIVEVLNYFHKPFLIQFISNTTVMFLPFIFFVKESNSIIDYTYLIDTRVKEINNILLKLSRSSNTKEKDSFQFKYIITMLKHDTELCNRILNKRFVSRKYKKYLNYIKTQI